MEAPLGPRKRKPPARLATSQAAEYEKRTTKATKARKAKKAATSKKGIKARKTKETADLDDLLAGLVGAWTMQVSSGSSMKTKSISKQKSSSGGFKITTSQLNSARDTEIKRFKDVIKKRKAEQKKTLAAEQRKKRATEAREAKKREAEEKRQNADLERVIKNYQSEMTRRADLIMRLDRRRRRGDTSNWSVENTAMLKALQQIINSRSKSSSSRRSWGSRMSV